MDSDMTLYPPHRPNSTAAREVFDEPLLHNEDCLSLAADGLDASFNGRDCDCVCAAFLRAEQEAALKALQLVAEALTHAAAEGSLGYHEAMLTVERVEAAEKAGAR